MKDIEIVKFIRHAPPYGVGETAGFPPDRAEALIKRGIAVKVEAPKREVGRGRRALSGESGDGPDYETK